MLARMSLVGLLVMLSTLCAALPARAEIISLGGSATAAIQEVRASPTGNTAQASKTFPGTGVTLPLQVIARLSDSDEEAAGSVAAQFADPNAVAGPNPEEFAFNLALNSLSPEIYYTAQASTEEVRSVQFTTSEAGVADGELAQFRGRVFIDGALAVFAVQELTDLTGTQVTFRVTIVQQTEGQADQEVFAGSVSMTGGANRQVTFAADGDFPTSGILDADLAALDPQLGVFHVAILPNLIVEYPFEARVGEPFTLRAKIAAEAANRPGGAGVAAVLGTPLDALQEVIALTRDQATAQKMTAALQQERAAPTGKETFPTANPLKWLFPACGLFGFESVLGVCGLFALRGAVRRPRTAKRGS
jgi:hypothetical protein